MLPTSEGLTEQPMPDRPVVRAVPDVPALPVVADIAGGRAATAASLAARSAPQWSSATSSWRSMTATVPPSSTGGPRPAATARPCVAQSCPSR